MRFHNCAQRSEEWDRLRRGIPTASCFDKIVTPGGKKGKPKPSSQWRHYACHLLAERILGRNVDSYTSPWMERGIELEDDAMAWYEYEKDIDTQAIGFITTDDGKIGCSPDRIAGTDGLVELKCPAPATMIEYHLFIAGFEEFAGGIEQDYRPQIQGQLYVSERQWCDIIAWHPELPRTVIRVERDEEFIEFLAEQLSDFNNYLGRISERICPDWQESNKATLREQLQASLGVVP
jgi:hypothetical protein